VYGVLKGGLASVGRERAKARGGITSCLGGKEHRRKLGKEELSARQKGEDWSRIRGGVGEEKDELTSQGI